MPNSDGTVLEVTIYDAAGNAALIFADEPGNGDLPIASDFEGAVDYVSFVTPETYGKPALIAPGKPGDTKAVTGDRVLYINTALVPAFLIERVQSDE